jgi:hypothetical protein
MIGGTWGDKVMAFFKKKKEKYIYIQSVAIQMSFNQHIKYYNYAY